MQGGFAGLALRIFYRWIMDKREDQIKAALIAILVAGITVFHYTTKHDPHAYYYQVFYQGLYFLPLIVASFWFGLRGSVLTSAAITALYLPFIVMHWSDFSPDDFNHLQEIVIYNIVAIVLGVLRDREKDRQAKLIEAERLVSMGRALSGLAHDMKTPLVAIGGFTNQVRKQLAADSPGRRKLDIVIHEVERLENMVMDMLDFSRPLEIRPCQTEMGEVIKECIAITEAMAEQKKVTLKREFSSDLNPVSIDAMRIKQVLINLLVNAIQASPEGEEVIVSGKREKSGMIIDIKDRGNGIDPDTMEEIFDPFFTTKKEGTGLGLPIAKRIVEAHAGRLEVLSRTGEGAVFRIVLPVQDRTGR